MRPRKVVDETMLDGLAKVFRAKGYEGASMKDLAEASGLKKASLYHRFPNGKQEMAEAVLQHLHAWVQANVFTVLLDENRLPTNRLKDGLQQIHLLYFGGEQDCIFRALTMESGLELFAQQIKEALEEWLKVLETLGQALGYSPTDAQAKAIQSLVELQGSLILARGLNDVSVFERSLLHIQARYLKS